MKNNYIDNVLYTKLNNMLTKPQDKASRKLVQILRHQIIDFNLKIDDKGFVNLDDIFNLNLKELININLDDVKYIVQVNEKKRLEIKFENDIIYIRAVQGHNEKTGSLIQDEISLEPILFSTNFIYHGTKKQYLDSILQNGLNKMNRKHIHFVENINKDKQISGFKKESDVILTIDIKKCICDGIKFYKSSNNVILTEGLNGIVSSKYINSVIYLHL